MERQAIAEVEGGIPALHARAFAELQVGSRDDAEDERRLQAVDDVGCFLDTHADAAIALGWSADALFGSGGLILSLRGATDVALTATTAVLDDRRVVHNPYLMSPRSRLHGLQSRVTANPLILLRLQQLHGLHAKTLEGDSGGVQGCSS